MGSITRVWIGLTLVAVLVACGSRRGKNTIEEALAAADAAYQPGTPGFEDEVARRLEAAAAAGARGAPLLWRQARLEVARGQASVDPILARDAFARGRALAATCLDLTPTVRRRRIAGEWSLAVDSVPEAARPCVAQLAWAWTRWFLAADPRGAALDRFALDVLVGRASGREAQWAAGLLAGLDRDVRTADGALASLATVFPNDLAIVADRIAWVMLPAGETVAAAERLEELRGRVRADVPRDQAALRAAERAVAGDVGAVPLPISRPDPARK